MSMLEAEVLKRPPILKKPELLAPAGNLEKLKFAIRYGADAVYLGGQQYSLRANADNFSIEEMKEGVDFANQYGARVYVATNIFAHNEDLPGLEDYLRRLEEIGVFGIIVADPVIIETCQRVAPKMEVHLSTQQSTLNWQAVKFWKEEGLHRIVLGREVSIEEIREIKAHVDIEIEQFIHGAMCISYSGRCVLSNHMTARDSNRGGCCQSCRWNYDLYEDDLGFYTAQKREIPLFDEGSQAFNMSSKDLCLIESIPEFIEAGVDSLKIEGRMKSIHYVATVVHVYRQVIDAYCADPDGYVLKQEWVDELNKAANRPTAPVFSKKGQAGPDEQIFGEAPKMSQYEFTGLVLDFDPETKIATIEQRNYFKVGQEVEFFGPELENFSQVVEEMWDEDGKSLDVARHPLQIVKIRVARPVKKFDIMRKENH